MNKTIKNRLIVEAIQGWHIFDRVLFGNTPTKYLKPAVQEQYDQLKKKYLLTLVEFYTKIGYKGSYAAMPKTDAEIDYNAYVVTEGLKKDFSVEFEKNKKSYTKCISEGVSSIDDDLLKLRTSYFCKSMMLENCFVNKPLSSCPNNLSKTELSLYKNCLTEVKNQLLNISKKYYTLFT